MSPNPNLLLPITGRPFYIIVTDHSGGAYLPERNTCDLDRASTVKDIADAQHTDILHVFECDPVQGKFRDVTCEIAREVCDTFDDLDEGSPQWQKDIAELAGLYVKPAPRRSPAAFDRAVADYDRTLAVLADEIGAVA